MLAEGMETNDAYEMKQRLEENEKQIANIHKKEE